MNRRIFSLQFAPRTANFEPFTYILIMLLIGVGKNMPTFAIRHEIQSLRLGRV